MSRMSNDNDNIEEEFSLIKKEKTKQFKGKKSYLPRINNDKFSITNSPLKKSIDGKFNLVTEINKLDINVRSKPLNSVEETVNFFKKNNNSKVDYTDIDGFNKQVLKNKYWGEERKGEYMIGEKNITKKPKLHIGNFKVNNSVRLNTCGNSLSKVSELDNVIVPKFDKNKLKYLDFSNSLNIPTEGVNKHIRKKHKLLPITDGEDFYV